MYGGRLEETLLFYLAGLLLIRRLKNKMSHQLQMIAATCIWVGMMWIGGVMLHLGYKDNPRQPKILVGRHVAKMMTLGAIEGEVAVVPTLFQLNNLFFLIGAITECSLNGWVLPIWTVRIWLAAFVGSGILSRVISRRA